MNEKVIDFVSCLHTGPKGCKIVLNVTGGGVAAISWLLGVPGASRTVLEARVPYSQETVTEFLGGHIPSQFASRKAAHDLAVASFKRLEMVSLPALDLRQKSGQDQSLPTVGVAMTAALATTSSKKGHHRAHAAVCTADGVTTFSLTLMKGHRTRLEEDTVASHLVMQALGTAMNIEYGTPNLLPSETIEIQKYPLKSYFPSLLEGTIQCIAAVPCYPIDARSPSALLAEMPDNPLPASFAFLPDYRPNGATIYPGSFNPLHEGHTRLAQASSCQCDRPLFYELAVVNADKPPLSVETMVARTNQFSASALGECCNACSRPPSVVMTRAPLFVEKAHLFRDATLLVGYDTALRIVNPVYYDKSIDKLHAALAALQSYGTQFVVAGRLDGQNFKTLEHIDIPKQFSSMFIPLENFRFDISSSEIRASRAQ